MAKAAGDGDVDERSLSAIFEKTVLTDARDEDVGKAVVVVITHRDAHPVHLYIKARFMGHVGKGAVTVVAVKPKSRCLALVTGPVHAIDKQDVLPAVAVIVEESAARTERFRKKFASIGTAVVQKLNAR